MINIVILLCSIFLSISSDVRGHEYIQLIEPHQERVLPFPPKPFPLLKSHSLDERKLSLNERRPGIEIGDFFISKTPSTPTWSAYDQENSYEQRNTLEIQENLEKLKSSEQIYYFGEEPLTVNINLPEKSYDEESYDKDYGVFRKNKEIFRVLSLDGGGIRGVIAATILAEVEKLLITRVN